MSRSGSVFPSGGGVQYPTRAWLSRKTRRPQDEGCLRRSRRAARVGSGEKREAVALEVANKYGVKEATLRTYLKPSRTPKWAKS